MTSCPCCGQPVAGTDILIEGRTVTYHKSSTLSPLQMTFFRVLHDAWPRTLSKAHLIDTIYSGTNSEPEIKTFDVHLSHLRAALRGTGLDIETIWGVGLRLVLNPQGADQ